MAKMTKKKLKRPPIQGAFTVPISPEEAAFRLHDLTRLGMQIDLIELDADNLRCIVRHWRSKKRLTVRGHFQRWQGTSTRVALHSRESTVRLIFDMILTLIPAFAITFMTFVFVFLLGGYGLMAFIMIGMGAVGGLLFSSILSDGAGLGVQYHDLKWTIRDALEGQLDKPQPRFRQADRY